MNSKDSALVLLSGGQDSTTCLYWAKQKFKKITALNIWYGQRHEVEIKAAKKIASLSEVLYTDFKTTLFQEIGDSALIQDGNVSVNHRASNKLPASFVPGRNVMFLTIASIIAYKWDIHDIVTGVCQVDSSGYPDCRDNTVKSLQVTLSLAMDYQLTIHTPLMDKTKKETVEMALGFIGCREALSWSHTCYEGQIPPCEECPACILRAKGFAEAGIPDPLIERLKGK
ncbi:MAG: 7-cyano-7-deazaguanine synthase QueC [Acidobacteriota bacterium]|nr:7-cyano-7-deazaguanine synthase QueC [Acidobacteriota bacterium]